MRLALRLRDASEVRLASTSPSPGHNTLFGKALEQVLCHTTAITAIANAQILKVGHLVRVVEIMVPNHCVPGTLSETQAPPVLDFQHGADYRSPRSPPQEDVAALATHKDGQGRGCGWILDGIMPDFSFILNSSPNNACTMGCSRVITAQDGLPTLRGSAFHKISNLRWS